LAQISEIHNAWHRKAVLHKCLTTGTKLRFFDPVGGPPLHNVLFSRKAKLVTEYLNGFGVEAKQQYRVIDNYPFYKDYFFEPLLLPESHRWQKQAIYLPFSRHLREFDVENMKSACMKAINKARAWW